LDDVIVHEVLCAAFANDFLEAQFPIRRERDAVGGTFGLFVRNSCLNQIPSIHRASLFLSSSESCPKIWSVLPVKLTENLLRKCRDEIVMVAEIRNTYGMGYACRKDRSGLRFKLCG
jgi:hypothetical protein